MKKIKIFDTTLRDGEQSPGCQMSIEEKVIIAKKLDEMHVDVIEAGFAASNHKDYVAIKNISAICNYSTVTSLARCNKNDIDIAYESIKDAKKKRIHVFIATSDIHMMYKLGKTKEEVRAIVAEMVSYAKTKCDDIEFSLEDATRTDYDFACEIIDIAISAGATTINIPDTVGYALPDEFITFLKYIKSHSKHINEVDMSVHCHNDLGLATSNSIAAIKCGATQIECTVNGIGERAGNTALEEVVATIKTKASALDAYTDIVTERIYDISKTVEEVTGSKVQNNKPIVGYNAFRHEAGIHQAGVIKNRLTYEILNARDYGIDVENIVIGIHSGKSAIIDKIKKAQMNPDDYDIDEIITQVKIYFETAKEMTDDTFFDIVSANKKRALTYA